METVLPLSRLGEMRDVMDRRVLRHIHEGQSEASRGLRLRSDRLRLVRRPQRPDRGRPLPAVSGPGAAAVLLSGGPGPGPGPVHRAVQLRGNLLQLMEQGAVFLISVHGHTSWVSGQFQFQQGQGPAAGRVTTVPWGMSRPGRSRPGSGR